MTTPNASALQQAPTHLSRFTGRPVATRADGKPIWLPRNQENRK